MHGAVGLNPPAEVAVSCEQVGSARLSGTLNQPCSSFVGGSGPCSHLAIAADVYLHNRDELLRRLGREVPVASSDAQLLLFAYEKWGTECPDFLLGDFAFAILDSRHRQLFCCRDHIGSRPFLYGDNGSHFVFASDSETLLAFGRIPRRVNLSKLAGLMVYGGHRDSADTFHAGITSLPPGTSLTVDAGGIRKRTYWEPQIRAGLVPHRAEDAFEALRDLLFQAVDCRLADGSSLAVDLSGGLDSSAVAGIAARCLAKKGGEVLALAGVLPEERRADFADERDFIDEFRSCANMRIEYVTASGRGPFDGIEDPARFLQTPLRSPFFYLSEALEQAAMANGANLVFWGDWGEMGATCHARGYYAELAVKLRWKTLAHELTRLRAVQGVKPLRFLAARLRELLPRVPGKSFAPYVLLTPAFARNGTAAPPVKCTSPDQRQWQLTAMRYFLAMASHQTGQTFGGQLRVSHPLGDKRVLEFCLAAPPELKIRDGYDRYLIRGSLEGVLPRRIQWRTSKVAYSPDYQARYRLQLDKARKFVAAIGPRDPVRSAIDVPRLGQLLQPENPYNHAIARDVVTSSIYTICFLRQFAEFRP